MHVPKDLKNIDKPSSVARNSKRLERLKKEAGLPSFQQVSALQELGMHEHVEQKLKLMERYAIANREIYNTVSAAGWKVANAVHNVVDLQGKIWELENELAKQGINPLTDPDYMKARELLGKEVQFIQKHGLESAKFQTNLELQKARTDDDSIFTVARETDE